MKALKAKKGLKGFSKWTFTEVESELKTRTGEETQPTTDEELPEGFRYVEEGEILPAGNYITKLSVGGKRTITNAPVKTVSTDTKADIERKPQK